MRKKAFASLALAGLMLAGSVMPASAATIVEGGHDFTGHQGKGTTTAEVCQQQEIDSDEKASCDVYAEIGSQFTVTIPKKLTLDGSTKTGSYTVSCSGDIAGTEYVSVTPDESFAMKQTGKANVTASITQETTKFRGDNYTGSLVAGEDYMTKGATGSISAQDLTAGAWNGTFNFAVKLNTDDASSN